jgi:hypothetical protein
MDPCAICCGPYKGSMRELEKEVDYFYERKTGNGAPAEVEMVR